MVKFLVEALGIVLGIILIFSVVAIPISFMCGLLDNKGYDRCSYESAGGRYNPFYRLGCELTKNRYEK